MNHHDTDPLFGSNPPPDHFQRLAESREWPKGLLERMMALKLPSWVIAEALSDTYANAVEVLASNVSDRERLSTELAIREATFEDDERVSDLFRSSSERLGDWDVVVDRSPNPFAQQRLQEHSHVKLLVDRGVALGVSVQSGRNTVVADERISVVWMGGWRIRDGLRRQRYSTLLLNSPWPASGLVGMFTYWYVRVANGAAQSWISKAVATAESEALCTSGRGLATVYHVDSARAEEAADAPTNEHAHQLNIRRITPDDIGRCVELINRTHGGLDLFRPYTADALEARLDDGYWGPRPELAPAVYGWDDMLVAEYSGTIVACAGAWDRGRDVREHWHNRNTDERRTVDNVCLMDWGFEAGSEEAMVELVKTHLRTARQLGRTTLVLPFQHHPELLEKLRWAAPEAEVRHLEVLCSSPLTFTAASSLTRPYTDLAYW